jgi:hypothetical protein
LVAAQRDLELCEFAAATSGDASAPLSMAGAQRSAAIRPTSFLDVRTFVTSVLLILYSESLIGIDDAWPRRPRQWRDRRSGIVL